MFEVGGIIRAGSYVALLREIYVAGKNPIRVPDLAASFDDAGFRDVRTYIQSGNVAYGPHPR